MRKCHTHSSLTESKLPPQIKPPLSLHQSSADGFEIADCDGNTCLWIRGKELARQTHALLEWFAELDVRF